MMATPEGRVKNIIKHRMKTAFPECWDFWPVQMGMGAHGVPDGLYVIEGRFFAIEAKALGGKPTARQEEQMRRIRAAGGYTWIVDSAEEAERAVRDIKKILRS